MARKTSTAIVRASTIPTVKIAVPRAAPAVRHAKPKRWGRRIVAAAGNVTPVKVAVTAAVIGLAEKNGLLDKLPEIPFVGRKGAIALVAWYWARHGGGPLARDVCLVAAALSGYQYGKEGKIEGEY